MTVRAVCTNCKLEGRYTLAMQHTLSTNQSRTDQSGRVVEVHGALWTQSYSLLYFGIRFLLWIRVKRWSVFDIELQR